MTFMINTCHHTTLTSPNIMRSFVAATLNHPGIFFTWSITIAKESSANSLAFTHNESASYFGRPKISSGYLEVETNVLAGR